MQIIQLAVKKIVRVLVLLEMVYSLHQTLSNHPLSIRRDWVSCRHRTAFKF